MPNIKDTELVQRVIVKVYMPHLAQYGKPTTLKLTYAIKGDVAVGDRVVVPPTKLCRTWSKGTVVGFDDGSYHGYIKYCKRINTQNNTARVAFTNTATRSN